MPLLHKIMITSDFHSHILPGADHGSASVETSLAQVKLISSAGVRRVVATPHFYPMADNVDSFLARRSACAARLAQALPDGSPDILLGAEVLVCEGIDRMEGLDTLAVRGTRTILLEMPMTKWSDKTFDTVDAITSLGLTAVMAHIDRYDPKYIDELMRLDVLAQLNPDAFRTRRGRKFAKKWLEAGKVAAVGSDLHGADEKGYAHFVSACEALGEHADGVERSMIKLLEGAEKLN